MWFKKMLGVASSDVLVLYAISNLILCALSIWCFINIIIYLYLRLFLSENKYLLSQMEKRKWLKRIINLYINTNMGWIYFEIGLYLFSMGTIIQTSLKIIYYSN